MQEIPIKELIDKIKLGDVAYDQLYNLDLEMSQYMAIKHYLEHQSDDVSKNQKLQILFHDIEVYSYNKGEFKPETAKSPISAITIYSTFEKVYHMFLLILPVNMNKFMPQMISDVENQFTEELRNLKFINKKKQEETYLQEDETVKIHLYQNNENALIKDCWAKIHELDPAVISGFFCDGFDIPYQYNRIEVLTGDEKQPAQIMSKFGAVKIRKMGQKGTFHFIADYPILDIQHLYKPRSEGGLNYGKAQAAYSLDWIAEDELGIKKMEYKQEGMSLDTFYETDPIGYFKYNLIDVILVKKLNEKLQHIDLHNLLRRDMKTPLTISLRGSSALFDTYFSYELEKNKKLMRYGIINEQSISLKEDEIKLIPKPIQKSVKFDMLKIDEGIYRANVSRYPGAYVKMSPSDMFDLRNGLPIDMDATALYPSMIQQYNISFDSYYGRILDPICYPFLNNFVIPLLGTNKNFNDIHKNFHENIFTRVCNYVDNRISVTNKNDVKQEMYYIIWDKMIKLKQANRPVEALFHPKTRADMLLLKNYLIPVLDLIVDISEKSEEYNLFCHDYLLNNDILTNCFGFPINQLYILSNASSPKISVEKIAPNEIQSYLQQNNLCLNISGALFYTHEYKLGTVYQFLEDRLAMRKFYKNKMYEFPVGSEEYKFYDSRQLAMKVNANSAYGLTGMSGFRFSNRWLAKSTTVSGRMTLKIAQIFGEIYLKSLEEI